MKFLPLVLFMTLQVQQELAKLFRRHLSLLLKLAIIPMISIVRIYYKDTITLSDRCHPLMDRHNYHPASLVLLSLQVV